MEQRCDGSEVLESSLPEREESDAGSQIQEAASGSSWENPEPEVSDELSPSIRIGCRLDHLLN